MGTARPHLVGDRGVDSVPVGHVHLQGHHRAHLQRTLRQRVRARRRVRAERQLGREPVRAGEPRSVADLDPRRRARCPGCARRPGVGHGRCRGHRQGRHAHRATHRADVRRDGQRGCAVGVVGAAGAPAGGWRRGRARHAHGRRRRLRAGRHRAGERRQRQTALHARRHHGVRRHHLAGQRDLGPVRRADGQRLHGQTGLHRRRARAGRWHGHRRPAGRRTALDTRPRHRRDAHLGRDHETGPDRGAEDTQLPDGLPGDLLVHRPRRGDVRHLQRVLHHGRSASARERAAARARRQPPPGHLVVAGRGRRGRPDRFAARAGVRVGSGVGHQGAAECPRLRHPRPRPRRRDAHHRHHARRRAGGQPGRRARPRHRCRTCAAGRGDERRRAREGAQRARSRHRRRVERCARCPARSSW